MENVNLLSDIEKDISGDWKSIQAKIRKKEENREIKHLLKNKSRWNIPHLDGFIELLKKITYEGNQESNLYELQILASRILIENKNGERLPKSFEKIWKIFCDPHRYKCSTIVCTACKRKYNIFYEDGEEYTYKYRYDVYTTNYYTAGELYRSKFHCIGCGSQFILNNGDVLGIFEE